MSKNIIITGASSGIGRATADCFLAAGWTVGLIARRSAVLSQVFGDNPAAMPLECDVSDEGAVAAAFDAFVAKFGRLDVLFNNAGLFTPAASIDEVTLKNWKTSVDVNLTGSFLCARKAFGLMRAQDPQGGRIINNGSISAHTPRPGSVAYTATKHAITGLTKSIALDGRPYRINGGQIDIGNAGTEMVTELNARKLAADPNATPDPVMDVNHSARAVLQMAELPLDTNTLFMTIMASEMAFVGRG
jgi:NAD(P)-dependent dehydrogenase (short-subunit alcohol dehydrogenase family)